MASRSQNVRIPSATYRLQFNSAFTFRDASEIVPYLSMLGISDVYASPLFQAPPGSTHGYDVTNYSRLNPELGTEEDFEAFTRALKDHRMGLIMDVVPNHMGIADASNTWWRNVLENGPSSPYAKYFDIDWNPPTEQLENKVLLPLLGDQYGTVLENGEIRLCAEEGWFVIRYFEKTFPISPKSAVLIFQRSVDKLHAVLGSQAPSILELESIMTSLRHLPSGSETDPEKVRELLREKEIIKRRFRELVERCGTASQSVHAAVSEFNGTPGVPSSFNSMETLLAQQAYRLCHWRVAADEINYRRFFDINELAAVRVEIPETFTDVHSLVVQLVHKGIVTGLRIDHPDGLFDPEKYFSDLQNACRTRAPGLRRLHGIYIVIEKILAHNEHLPPQWAVHGTVGYDFLNIANGIFVRPSSRRRMTEFYSSFTGATKSFRDLVYECKKLILRVSMTSELHVLARRLDKLSFQHRSSCDFTLWSLQEALGEVVACFPVYRSYVRTETGGVSDHDRSHIHAAILMAERRNPALNESIFRFIESILLLEDPPGLSPLQISERRDFVMRFQQFTGPVMAKGLEDTAFYRQYPLASLNEVGGRPEKFATSVEEFHRHNEHVQKKWPHTLVTTSTHDSKRSEDVRSRINVLSEIPQEWESKIRTWSEMNQSLRSEIDGEWAPDANEEVLIYQTLFGAWPLAGVPDDFIARVKRYMEKALKEAKVHTSWVSPHAPYDEAIRVFIDRLFENDHPFFEDFKSFQARYAAAGLRNSLSQTLMKITCPGVPDFYQGTELWDFHFVDPDNRDPVDYFLRKQLITFPDSPVQWAIEDPRTKLSLIRKALKFRAARLELFQKGEYIPIETSNDSVIAYMRRKKTERVIVACERFFASADADQSALLYLRGRMAHTFRDVLTGRIIAAEGGLLDTKELFSALPAALLETHV